MADKNNIIEGIFEDMSLQSLCSAANKLEVSYEIEMWHDDEWHDKFDELKVKCAAELERIINEQRKDGTV